METRQCDVLMEPLTTEQYAYTIILFVFSLAFGFWTDDFGTIVSLNGATAGNLIGLLLPAGYYLWCAHEMECKACDCDTID